MELIVVLSIFSVISSISMFNYGDFQARVDIRNLASDIALKVVEAQKSALSGKLSTQAFTFKPAYGVYFTSPSTSFIYFADFNNINGYEVGAGETLDTINITKGNSIERIDICTNNPCTLVASTNSLSITFKRSDSSAVFTGASVTGSQYIQITIKSPKGMTAVIKLYPSGRVQVN